MLDSTMSQLANMLPHDNIPGSDETWDDPDLADDDLDTDKSEKHTDKSKSQVSAKATSNAGQINAADANAGHAHTAASTAANTAADANANSGDVNDSGEDANAKLSGFGGPSDAPTKTIILAALVTAMIVFAAITCYCKLCREK